MALNDTTADALGTAIADALLAMPGSPSAEARWQEVCRRVYAALIVDAELHGTITPAPGGPVTVGVDPGTHTGSGSGGLS